MSGAARRALPELLAPAGNMERLETALRFGADAVYLGTETMSLRNYADNFRGDALNKACETAHAQGKRVYVACNAFARDAQMRDLPPLLRAIRTAGADALIVNDPGVIRVARDTVPELPLHLSTQANTLNAEAALFWHEAGIRRIVLARELTLDEIKAMRAILPETLELEIFVHGAMCVSYSGRCLLSNYIAGRDSNRGECAQPCRWTYELRERGRDGAYFGIEQDALGTYILNARDLNLIGHLPAVLETGACSLKIEGRMKSVAYVATVVNAYRMALDHYAEAPDAPLPHAIAEELNYASHRPYTTGFAFGDPGAAGQAPASADYVSDAQISAVVLSYDAASQTAHVLQRNRFFDGDTLSILSPGDIARTFVVHGIRNEAGEAQQSAPHPKQSLFLGCSEPLKAGDILRKILPQEEKKSEGNGKQ